MGFILQCVTHRCIIYMMQVTMYCVTERQDFKVLRLFRIGATLLDLIC